jgi:hypothetical protein
LATTEKGGKEKRKEKKKKKDMHDSKKKKKLEHGTPKHSQETGGDGHAGLIDDVLGAPIQR